MLHPSYVDLMKVVNQGVEEGEAPVISSRYSIVMATAKRARQLVDGEEALVRENGRKPLSIAVDELNQGQIQILGEDDEPEDELGELSETEGMEVGELDAVELADEEAEERREAAEGAADTAEETAQAAGEAEDKAAENAGDAAQAGAEA